LLKLVANPGYRKCAEYILGEERKLMTAEVSNLDVGAIDEPPYFVLDPERLRVALHDFRDAFPGVQIYYALKANSEPIVLTTLSAEGCGFEAASWGEIQILRALGIASERIIYGTAVKPRSHVERAYHEGITQFSADSAEELLMLSEVAPRSRVFIRVKIDDSHSVFQMNGKFGADVNEAANLLLTTRQLGLKPWGLSFNVGSQASRATQWSDGINVIARVIRGLYGLGIRLEILNIGGGFPVVYQGQSSISLTDIASHVYRSLAELPYQPRLIVEPGRRLVASSTSLVSNVISRINRPDGVWLFLDSGVYNALFEALVHQGKTRYPIQCMSNGKDCRHSTTPFILAGPTGDGLDVIARDVLLPAHTTVGDTLLFKNVGAYTIPFASRFNGFEIPPIRVLPCGNL
jgi:ornithine decarboxylase